MKVQNPICPTCSSKQIIRFGTRKTKLEKRQMYTCKDCKKKFTLSKNIKNKTYPSKIILRAISLYNLGYPLKRIAKILNKQHSLTIRPSTIHVWTQEYNFGYKRYLNYKGRIIKKQQFLHHNINYNLKYHLIKLKHQPYQNLTNYIKSLDSWIDKYFKEDQRCSKIKLNTNTIPIQKQDQSIKLAKLALTQTANNKTRHHIIESFMLINDNNTIATEIPIYFYDKTIGKINGHIDILQIKNNRIYILDYKPKAHKENSQKVTTQLTLYAIALSFRTKIPLRKIRCAYFDENNYFEFKPRYKLY